jgi:4-diphosphocytidyl-2-C-methyl-D-erythritol kinase
MVYKKQFETVGEGLLVRAPAKLNLSLLIAGRRPDGFHEIETIMAKVSWYDELLIQRGQKPGLELICEGPCWAPAGQENLIYRACGMLLAGSRSQAAIKITLTKNIPAGSGLGSASSDAAAALLGLSRFLRLGFDRAGLSKLAVLLGSDVAFFLDGPLAFCSGKGEKIKQIDKNFNFLALVILPDISVSTKEVYDNYKHDQALYELLRTRISDNIRKNRIDLASKMCANMLQSSCFSLFKGLAELKAGVESLGLVPVCLTGSGAAMFYIFDNINEKETLEYRSKLQQKFGCKSIIVANNLW